MINLSSQLAREKTSQTFFFGGGGKGPCFLVYWGIIVLTGKDCYSTDVQELIEMCFKWNILAIPYLPTVPI